MADDYIRAITLPDDTTSKAVYRELRRALLDKHTKREKVNVSTYRFRRVEGSLPSQEGEVQLDESTTMFAIAAVGDPSEEDRAAIERIFAPYPAYAASIEELAFLHERRDETRASGASRVERSYPKGRRYTFERRS